MKKYIKSNLNVNFEFLGNMHEMFIDYLIETKHEIIIITLVEENFDGAMKLLYWTKNHYKVKYSNFQGEYRIIYPKDNYLENLEISDRNYRYWIHNQKIKILKEGITK